MRTIIGIIVAGAAGALTRYAIDGEISQRTAGAFPWGTFVINVSGSLLLGFVFTLFTDRVAIAPWMRSSVTMGFLGAYTTFSTLSLETVRLIEDRVYLLALANAAGSLLAGLGAVFVGIMVARTL